MKISEGGQIVVLLFLYIKYNRSLSNATTLHNKRTSKKRGESDENHEMTKIVCPACYHLNDFMAI